MSIVRRTSPFGELLSLRQAMDRLFEDSFVRPRGWTIGALGGQNLPLDVYETPDAIVVKAALPGVRPEDVEVTVTGDTLTIAASFKEERETERAGYVYQELRRGDVSRTISLPGEFKTDRVTTTFEHGMLALSFPRVEQAKPQRIKITPSSEAASKVAVETGESAGAGAPASGR